MHLLLLLLLAVPVASTPCLENSKPPVQALHVLGQPNFTSGSPSMFTYPVTITISPTPPHKMFVSQEGSAPLILRFETTKFDEGTQPEFSFGYDHGCTASSMLGANIFVDAEDNLWSADNGLHRVVMIANASSISDSSPKPEMIVGQEDSTTCTSGIGLNNLYSPFGVLVDNKWDNLWIADTMNTRVLRFDNLSTQPKINASATIMLGSTGLGGCLENTLYSPIGLGIDSEHNLWVADQMDNRILVFYNAYSKQNHDKADMVFGQPGFSVCSQYSETTQATFSYPNRITFDSDDTIYISDRANNRIMAFLNASNIGNFLPEADFQIGQPNFNTNSQTNTSDTSLYQPNGVVFDTYLTNSLIVVSFDENRVLRYCSN